MFEALDLLGARAKKTEIHACFGPPLDLLWCPHSQIAIPGDGLTVQGDHPAWHEVESDRVRKEENLQCSSIRPSSWELVKRCSKWEHAKILVAPQSEHTKVWWLCDKKLG